METESSQGCPRNLGVEGRAFGPLVDHAGSLGKILGVSFYRAFEVVGK